MNPMRIVSTLPSTTHILKLLGLEASIVAADGASIRLFGLKSSDIGEPESINHERIQAARPDLLIANNCVPGMDAITQQLEEESFATLKLSSERFDDLLSDIYTIGVECLQTERASRLVEDLHARIKSCSLDAALRPEPTPCYVELWPSPFVSVGSQNWISDMLHKCGGINIFQDTYYSSFWPEEEEIIARAPELIFFLWRGYGDNVRDFDVDKILSRPGWSEVPAVKNKRLVPLPESLFLYPGPRLVEGLELLVQHLSGAGVH